MGQMFAPQISYQKPRQSSLVPRLKLGVLTEHTSNTHHNKSGDDCDELDADWMTVCQLFLEIYDTHYYRTQKQNDIDWPTEVMASWHNQLLP